MEIDAKDSPRHSHPGNVKCNAQQVHHKARFQQVFDTHSARAEYHCVCGGGYWQTKKRLILHLPARNTYQKAKEQLTQVGTIKNSGLILIATAVEATIGSIIDATA